MLSTIPILAFVLAAAPVPATLSDAAFMTGRWVDDGGGALSEETWSTPSGDGTIGMWRYVKDGKVRVLEFLSIAAEDGSLVLRFRHFDPMLVGREEKERPVVLHLVKRGDGALRFEGPRVDGGAGPVALTFLRKADGLEVTLEKDGKPQPFTFRKGT